MIKLGMLDFDSSHSVEFTKRLNHVDCPEDQWVSGAKVVIGCAGESKMSPERIPGFRDKIKSYGVPLVDKPTDMIGKVDGMLIESVDGSVHLERARPFLEAGIPCYVDKPFTCSTADARALIDLSEKKKLPIFSSSSLRYVPELVEYLGTTAHGKVVGCVSYGPASESVQNPGLFNYGIHAIEVLYAVMGPGCVRVTSSHEKGTDLATGTWKDGRIASIRGIRTGRSGFGVMVFAEKEIKPLTLPTTNIYRELLKRIVSMFETGKSPLAPAETLEIIAFIEAANQSGANHGAPVAVKF